ncbi:MAG: hypothetical protein Q4G11_07280, partial [Gallicola sp.]|nr:hypothetical protein [Gallicola sp.]
PWMQEFVLTKFRAYAAGGFNVTECWDSLLAENIKRNGGNYGKLIGGKVKPFGVEVVSRFLDGYYRDNDK